MPKSAPLPKTPEQEELEQAEQAARELEALSGSQDEETPPAELEAVEQPLVAEVPVAGPASTPPGVDVGPGNQQEQEEPLLLESVSIVAGEAPKPKAPAPPVLEEEGWKESKVQEPDVNLSMDDELDESFELAAADSQEFGAAEIAPEARAAYMPLKDEEPRPEAYSPIAAADFHDQSSPDLDLDAVLTDDQKDRSQLWEELAQAEADIAAREEARAEPLTVEEIEPIDEEDERGLSVAERARARFRATALTDFDDSLAPSFLVDEDTPTSSKGAHQLARHAVVTHISGQGGALARALLQRALQGDKRALELCVGKLLPVESLRAFADSLTRKALELALDKESSLLAAVAGDKGASVPDVTQARTIAANLVRFALEGDEEAMELCLTFSGTPPEYAETIQTLADKLLHKALAGDARLLELMLKRLGSGALPEGADKSVADSMLERALQGDPTAIKACLARLIRD